LGYLSHNSLATHTMLLLNSLCCYFPAQHLILKTRKSPQSASTKEPYKFCECKQVELCGAIFDWFGWFSIVLLLKAWLLLYFSFHFVWVKDILWRTSFLRAMQGLISLGRTEKKYDANMAKHNRCTCQATIRATIGTGDVWWCNGNNKIHVFLHLHHPDCLWPLPKQM